MHYRSVFVLSVGHLVTDVNQGCLPALLPFLINAHHLSYAAAAGIIFAANAASTIVQPLFGYTSDRVSKPVLLPIGLVLAGLGLALIGVSPGYLFVMASAVLSGIGVAAYHPEAARLVNLSAGAQKATAMSLFGVGGAIGFALGPLVATGAVLTWGLKGTITLIAPAGLMALIVAAHIPGLPITDFLSKKHDPTSSEKPHRDAWGPFVALTGAVIGRSVLFYSLNTFIPLYWINVLDQSEAMGGMALTAMAASGVVGNILGGRMADRFGRIKMIVAGFSILILLFPALLWTSDPHVAMILLVPIGMALFIPYGPMIVMGQTYLPSRIGFSSGVTLGLAITIGGMAAPLLGKVADIYGIRCALTGIAVLPILMALLSLTLPDRKKLRRKWGL